MMLFTDEEERAENNPLPIKQTRKFYLTVWEFHYKKPFPNSLNNLNACNDPACMHDACGVIDTACTIDERFERPSQPLKGKSFKNINVPESSYPTHKKIYKFKGAT
jgi:hypothetical protein